jgi:hypothetical protein
MRIDSRIACSISYGRPAGRGAFGLVDFTSSIASRISRWICARSTWVRASSSFAWRMALRTSLLGRSEVLPTPGLAIDVDRSHRQNQATLLDGRPQRSHRGYSGDRRAAGRRAARRGLRSRGAADVDIIDARRGQRQGDRDGGEDYQPPGHVPAGGGVGKHGLEPPVQGVASIERRCKQQRLPEGILAIARP